MLKFKQILLTLLAIFMPFLVLTPFRASEENIRLNVSLISDTHIDYRELYSQYVLADILRDVEKSSDGVDAFVVTGDLTNYGDGKSVEKFFDILKKHSTVENMIIASGNHDIGHVEDVTHEQARQRLIEFFNEYIDAGIRNIYYSRDVNGYTFIVLGDQDDDSWDFPEYYEDQLEFLDSELARATANGKPAFVISHVPVQGPNGQEIIWEDGAMRSEFGDPTREILEKYENVFFISGHLHAGINGELVKNQFGFSCVETINSVTYVNLPTVYLVNRYGIPWGGTGFQMEVYDDEVLFRARDFMTSSWYPSYDYSVALTAD